MCQVVYLFEFVLFVIYWTSQICKFMFFIKIWVIFSYYFFEYFFCFSFSLFFCDSSISMFDF